MCLCVHCLFDLSRCSIEINSRSDVLILIIFLLLIFTLSAITTLDDIWVLEEGTDHHWHHIRSIHSRQVSQVKPYLPLHFSRQLNCRTQNIKPIHIKSYGSMPEHVVGNQLITLAVMPLSLDKCSTVLSYLISSLHCHHFIDSSRN